MSKISDLAKNFQQNSQNEAKNIELQAKNDIQELRRAIREELKASEQKITSDIRAQQLRMSKMIFKPYLWSLGGLLLVGIIITLTIGLANWYIVEELKQQKAELAEAKRATEKLDQYSKKIQLSTCTTRDKQSVICVAIDPNSPAWGENGTYRAILPRPSK